MSLIIGFTILTVAAMCATHGSMHLWHRLTRR